MRHDFACFTLLLALFMTPFFAYPQAGTLDNTFDGDGIALYLPGVGHDNAQDVKCLNDTSILVCGNAKTSGINYEGILMKVLKNGSLATAWGTNGVVSFQFGTDTYVSDMIFQPNGKILVSGTVYTSATNAEFFVARFNPNGTPDLTFNATGHAVTSFSSFEDNCYAMVLQPDGKIVLVGSASTATYDQLLFVRFNANGTIDNAFGINGYRTIDASVQSERINTLGLLSNGTIVGMGSGYQDAPYYNDKVFMAKLTPGGAPMPGFGTNGVIIPPVFTNISKADQLLIDNNTIYATGFMFDAASELRLFLTKLDTTGAVNSAFGTNGISFLKLNPVNEGLDIIRSSDGKIYISGTTGLGGMNNRDFLLARFTPTGQLDPSFNTTGYTVTPIRPDWDEAVAMDMQIDGKLVLTGMSSGLTSSGNNDLPVTRYLNDFTPPGCYTNFTASTDTLCQGGSVTFTDLTVVPNGSPTTWNWSFPGGAPAASTLQNPVITYSTPGVYNVQLISSNGVYSDTLLRTAYIHVETTPLQPSAPAGPGSICSNTNAQFTTNPVQYATSYEWQITPPDAGSISGSGPSAIFTPQATWSGNCTIRVRAVGNCGQSPWSASVQCTVHHSPVQYFVNGNGTYCTGSQGAEILLGGSETATSYQLYFEGNPTGTIVSGTGSSLSFGFVTAEGAYTVKGSNANCSDFMFGAVNVDEVSLPVKPSTPAGPTQVLNNETSVYTVPGAGNGETYTWTLTPASAGSLTSSADSATIQWNSSFNGTATLTVHGQNICGTGPESDPLEITVSVYTLIGTSGSGRFYLFPNPARTQLNVVFAEAGIRTGGSLSVVNMQGTVMVKSELGSGTEQVKMDVSRLAPGSYLLLLQIPGERPTTAGFTLVP